ncbi:SCO6745 family protein [Streptomyces luteireticuli]|uniref:SalK n=1 Tax=Streptomyces luteireticuli TaxID=173858 RepID=A0ABP3IDW1_9ACTN
MDAAATARTVWQLTEPVHAVTYFAPEGRAVFEEAGLRGWWRAYFAGRSAPFGPVGPELVTATFFGFAPGTVARALPSVWEIVSPGRALELRRAGAHAALRRLLAGLETEAARAAELLGRRLEGLDCAGRALGAANAALGLPVDPLDRLWHAATLLREHRGDGHVAALVAAGVDGCESLVLRSGIDVPREALRPFRGWTDEEWEAAAGRLADRGLLDADGRATEEGRRVYAEVEAATDLAASRPWQDPAPEDVDALLTALAPLSRACAAVLPELNPIGLPQAS